MEKKTLQLTAIEGERTYKQTHRSSGQRLLVSRWKVPAPLFSFSTEETRPRIDPVSTLFSSLSVGFVLGVESVCKLSFGLGFNKTKSWQKKSLKGLGESKSYRLLFSIRDPKTKAQRASWVSVSLLPRPPEVESVARNLNKSWYT